MSSQQEGNEDSPIPNQEAAETNSQSEEKAASFKKPILVGKIGRIPRKIIKPVEEAKTAEDDPVTPQDTTTDNQEKKIDDVKVDTSDGAEQKPPRKENNLSLPYKEPSWSGLPESAGQDYSFDVLKGGSIIETINLMKRPFWVFGRLESCHISMQHPTISRYHAVLQYRDKITDEEPPGFYIYDLESTHGTFLNKQRIRPRVYVRMQVGHMLKLGCSTRTYILNGPEEDTEEESELTVTELKKKRQEELLRREQEKLKKEQEEEERLRKEEEKGVDWGMGDDADEESDLAENPFAQTNNEELYIDDPKKALRGFFEREGLDLEYDCSEQGMGQFLCKVMLPLDDDRGRPIYAEVLHKGKKKEAVVQCALEACRILDRHGVLRQATHESRKRKAKNWEENDYYDSDEDTFLDRTGTIEKKRESRMKAKKAPEAETYQSLLEKEKKLSNAIADIERQLNQSSKNQSHLNSSNLEEDSLDSYMKQLKQPKLDKQKTSQLKAELAKLKQEHASVIKLANIAKPADLPPLTPHYISQPSTSSSSKGSKFPVFGKRLKVKVQLPERPKQEVPVDTGVDEDEDDEEVVEEKKEEARGVEKMEVEETPSEELPQTNAESSGDDELNSPADEEQKRMCSLERFEKSLNRIKMSPLFIEQREKVNKVLDKLKALATEEDRMSIDWKLIAAKRRKVQKLIEDSAAEDDNSKIIHKVRVELSRILVELEDMTTKKFKAIDTVKEVVDEIKSITVEINEEEKRRESEGRSEETEEDIEKRRKKNQRRIQQRQNKVETERQKGYQEDASKEDYNMWVPPADQTGDGKTSLNEKFGY